MKLLKTQNEDLTGMLNEYEISSANLRSSLEEAEKENARLRSLLTVREETISEMSGFMQSLLQKQSTMSKEILEATMERRRSVDSVQTMLRPHSLNGDHPSNVSFFIGSSARSNTPEQGSRRVSIASITSQLVSRLSALNDPPTVLKNSDRKNSHTPATTVCTSFEGADVLEGLESQLRRLDERKKQLEVMLESVAATGC